MAQKEELEEINSDRLLHEQIEKRAYEIYLSHDGRQGSALEDWLAAEQELSRERGMKAPAPPKAKAALRSQ